MSVKVILGDNPFLGVAHLDSSKVEGYRKSFADSDRVLDVISHTYDCGVRDFFYTVHPQYEDMLNRIAREGLFPDMGFYPCIPYAHKYNDLLAAGGVRSLITDAAVTLMGFDNVYRFLRMMLGGKKILPNFLIDYELRTIPTYNVKGIYILNVLADLMISVGNRDFFIEFHNQCKKRGMTPGLMTLNVVACINLLEAIGLSGEFSLCTNVNEAGFKMNPGPEQVAEAIRNYPGEVIAMNTITDFGRVEECLKYAAGFKGVDGVVFGSGNKKNIEKNVKMLSA